MKKGTLSKSDCLILEAQQAILESLSDIHLKLGNGRAAIRDQDRARNIQDVLLSQSKGEQ
mgnify:CR=1 FL=1